MQTWDTLDSTYLFKNGFANIRRDTVRLPNGMILDDYIVNEYPDWVNVIALTADRRIVLVRQYRHGCGEVTLEAPGGVVQPGEAPEAAATRELREETGFAAKGKSILLGDYYTNPATSTNRIKSFLLLDVEQDDEPEPDETEQLESLLVPFASVFDLAAAGQLVQMFTVSACYFADRYLKAIDAEGPDQAAGS